jgi:hypothetical protein
VVTAQGSNGCGVGTVRSTPVKLAVCPVPFAATPERSAKATSNLVAKIQVYPNPTTETFQLQLRAIAPPNSQIRLFDASGRLLEQRNISGQQSLKIGAALKAGTYLLEIRYGNQLQSERLLKF